MLVRAEAFQAVGGFDESFFMYFEDVDLCLRLEAAGWRLAQEPRAVVHHAGGVAAGVRSTTSTGRRSSATIGFTGRCGKVASSSVACVGDSEMRR